MDNTFILFLENDLIYNDIIESIQKSVRANEMEYNYLINLIFNNYLLILFSISCFTTVFCCSNRKNHIYKPIKQIEEIHVKGIPV